MTQTNPHLRPNKAVRNSIREIVNYNWQDERWDHEENGEPEGHVFEHLQRIEAWLDSIEGT